MHETNDKGQKGVNWLGQGCVSVQLAFLPCLLTEQRRMKGNEIGLVVAPKKIQPKEEPLLLLILFSEYNGRKLDSSAFCV